MKLETFDFNESPVRVVISDQDGSPWFVAADVCRVLEHSNARQMIAGLDEDEKGVSNADTPGGVQKLNIISESGLYALVLKSRKAEAKKFRKWVTSVVLPEIRRTGAYSPPLPLITEDVVSVLGYVRECCAGWPLERQIEFGMQARRFAKGMGIVFQTGHEPGVGRVFVFPRLVLEEVRKAYPALLVGASDEEARDFEKVLHALHELHGDGRLAPDVVREAAKQMKLFPRIFTAKSTLPAERSSFGWLCERFNGRPFPSGLVLRVCGLATARRYEVRLLKAGADLAMAG